MDNRDQTGAPRGRVECARTVSGDSDSAGCDTNIYRRQIRSALEARDAFVAAMVHELRSPMAPIFGQIELLQDQAVRDGASPGIIRGMEKLRAAVDNYMRRSATLIETARLASGRRQLHPEMLNLSELVCSAVDNYSAVAARDQTQLQVDLESGIIGWWDALAVEQIVDNLVSNALKYGGRSLVTVRLVRESEQARLTISDCGVGILLEDQQAIFAPFEQMVRGAARRGGFGMGLWVVRELVEAMAGSITLETAPGRGATFIISLPIDVREVPDTARRK